MDKREKLGPGGWLLIVLMLAMLAGAIAYAVQVWTSVDAHLSTLGWIFLVLGVLISLALGVGLMALVFYSSRNNYDR